jgi:hypothetical protein
VSLTLRIPVIIFVIGLILFIGGIVLAIAMPATATWKPRSEVLASKELLTVSAGWVSKDDSLIDAVITVDEWETYDYWFGYIPLIFEEAKDFLITGTAIEQSSPQRKFNFYIFDSVNFDLWKAGKAYKAYYEDKGETTVSFSFSIPSKDEVPNTFYFIIEEYGFEILILPEKPVVRVTATINWIEKAAIYDHSEYLTSWEVVLTIEEAKDFILEGSAIEVKGNKFNFYIFDSTNYFNWISGKPYTSYYEVKNVTTTSFSIPLTKDEATSIFYFVVENPLSDINETVELSATIKWTEKATIATTVLGIILGGVVILFGLIIMVISGIATLVFRPKAPVPAPATQFKYGTL